MHFDVVSDVVARLLPRLGICIVQINHDFLPVPSKPVLLYMGRQ